MAQKKHNELLPGQCIVTEYDDAYHYRFRNKSVCIKKTDDGEGYVLFFKNTDKIDPIEKPAVSHEVLKGKVRASAIKLSTESLIAILKGYVALTSRISLLKYPTKTLDNICQDAINKYPDKVKSYHTGEKGIFGIFMGEVMKESKGLADPKLVDKILKSLLDNQERILTFPLDAIYVPKVINDLEPEIGKWVPCFVNGMIMTAKREEINRWWIENEGYYLTKDIEYYLKKEKLSTTTPFNENKIDIVKNELGGAHICPVCDNGSIMVSDNYCTGCGVKINWIIA